MIGHRAPCVGQEWEWEKGEIVQWWSPVIRDVHWAVCNEWRVGGLFNLGLHRTCPMLMPMYVLVFRAKRETSNIAECSCWFWVTGRAHRFWIEIFLFFPPNWFFFLVNSFLLYFPPPVYFCFELNVQVINTKPELIN